MTLASCALAPEFEHSSADSFGLTPQDVVDPVLGTVATGTYRMWLAPSATCFLRALQSAINAALLAEASATTVAITLSAAGVVTLTFSANVNAFQGTALLHRRLGLAAGAITPSGLRVVAGTRPAWHLALITAAVGPYWQPLQAGGAEQTTGGRVYAIAATATSWQRSLKVSFQPTTPALRAAHNCDATAMYPAEAYMDALGSAVTDREWSVLDVLYAARGMLCGYTATWATARTSTTERTWRTYVGPRSLLSPATTLLRPEWLAFTEWTLDLVAPSSSPTETRA